jgi:hypothetical protein
MENKECHHFRVTIRGNEHLGMATCSDCQRMVYIDNTINNWMNLFQEMMLFLYKYLPFYEGNPDVTPLMKAYRNEVLKK